MVVVEITFVLFVDSVVYKPGDVPHHFIAHVIEQNVFFFFQAKVWNIIVLVVDGFS